MRDNTISLLSFNTLGTPFFAPDLALRYKKAAELIAEKDIDLICLQEIHTYYHVHLLKRYLPQYPYMAYKHYIGGPKGGLVILSKHPLDNITYHNFSHLGTWKNISWYTKILKNGVLTASLKGTPLIILNTFLITDFEFHWSPKNRFYNLVKAQVEETANITNHYSKPGKVLLITGDFNMAKSTALYDTFLQQTDSHDLFKKYDTPTYHFDHIKYIFKGKKADRIDFIFIKADQTPHILETHHMFDTKVPITSTRNSFLSDHIGLYTKLKY
jgi:endonuclease/exonuclease/phosphatase family metal-dependent hydrolase